MIALHTLTRTEKLQAMEALWEDLSSDAVALQSPAWHEDELRAAESAVASGDARFVSLDDAKRLLARKDA
jgi:hypothetical protein